MNKASHISQLFESLDQVQTWILSLLLENGEWVQPRGLKTLEISPITFTLSNPRKRCVFNYKRRWSLPLAIGEFCWHLSGSNQLHFIQYYARRWKDFSEDGSIIIGSCYGHKIFFQKEHQLNQWKKIVQLLKTDPHSRRAILTFIDRDFEVDAGAKDIACACTLQFMIRSGQLHALGHMRSNDVIWGLPYDIFLFTMLQEMLAYELELNLGTYTHFVGSIHVYEPHLELAKCIIENNVVNSFEMPPMGGIEKINTFLCLEAQIREKKSIKCQDIKSLDKYWQDLLAVLNWYRLSKEEGGYSKVSDKIPNNFPYHILLQNMITQTKTF
jgi:thymidylate synthase